MVLFVPVLCTACTRNRETHRLNTIAEQLPFRYVNTRIGRLPYRPLREHADATESAAVLRLRVQANELSAQTAEGDLRGRALLLAGDSRHAIDALRTPAATGDAHAVSDLAAALIDRGITTQSPELLLDGLDAARRAMRQDRTDTAAWFNSGLALEHLGLSADAKKAYAVVQRLDAGDGWAAEAARRAQALTISDPEAAWSEIEKGMHDERGAAAAERQIARESGTARRIAEWNYLTEWANARLSGDGTAARLPLDKARIVSGALVRSHKERLLADAVGAIDRAEATGVAPQLARAHIAYDAGRNLLRANDANAALARFSEASAAFAKARSPMEYLTKYYASGAYYSQGRIAETVTLLDEVDRNDPLARGYRALAAQLGWHRGICFEVRGEYARAVDTFQRSSDIAAEIHDALLTAQFDNLSAEALEHLGRTSDAWRLRIRALRGLSALSATQRVAVTLMSAANLQLSQREWTRCVALHDSALPAAEQLKNPILATFILSQLAIAHEELRHAEAAAADRKSAETWLKKITEPKVHHRLEVELEIANGVALRLRSPQEAIAHFGRAVRQFETSGERAHLPRLYLERGRAYHAMGDDASYRGDLAHALALTESWRDNVADMDERAALNIWSESVRRDAIALELSSGNVSAAFELAERGRADAPTLTLPRVSSSLAHDAAIIEYAATPRGMVAFVIRSDESRAVLLPARIDEISAAAARFRETGGANAAELWRLTLQPIRRLLSGVAILVVVPERELTGIPFGALYDSERRRFVVDDFAVVHSNSTEDSMRASRVGTAERDRALVIGADVFADSSVAPLPSVAAEARIVARSWPNVILLTGDAARTGAMRQESRRATFIHFAGHIVHRAGSSQLLLSDGVLPIDDIGRMSLEHVRLVVLAGCRGAKAKTSYAVVTDAASAFLAAKAHTVLASVSDLDDRDSARIMEQLSPLLAQGTDPAVAVQTVASAERRTGQTSALALMVLGGSPRMLAAQRQPGMLAAH
jgi:tetratricopeptide (TPR) repeat protein